MNSYITSLLYQKSPLKEKYKRESCRIVSLLLLLTFTAGLWACSEEIYLEPKLYGSVKGQVLYMDTREPVANALVRLNPGGHTVDTDSSGNFEFKSLTVGDYTIQATSESYRAESSTITVEFNEVTTTRLLLTLDDFQNRAPNRPELVSPSNGGNINTTAGSTVLKWKATDPNRDTLTYDVYLFREGENATKPFLSGVQSDSVIVNNLAYNTTYYWQVVAKDRNSSTFGEIWSFKTGSFPELSFVYVRQVENQLQIFTSSPGSEEVQLTRTGSNWRPIVSPNREEIAYISNIGGELHLYVMNRSGSNVRKVTTIPVSGVSATDLSFCWSPDGTQLLYPSNDKLYAVRTDGVGLRQVARTQDGRFFSGCDWNATTNQIIARTTSGNIYDTEFMILDANNGNVIRKWRPASGRTSNPVFSITGEQILYSRDITAFENPQGRQLDAHIFLHDLKSNAIQDLSEDKERGTNDLEPRFDPTGAKILFTNVPNDDFSARTIMSMDITGENRSVVVANAQMPYWR